MSKLNKEGNVIFEDIRQSKRKVRIVETYYSILTEGPLQGRPSFFIVVENENTAKGKKTTIKKIAKQLNEKCASHFAVINSMNNDLVSCCIRLGMTVMVEVHSKGLVCPDMFPWVPNGTFIVVKVDSPELDKEVADNAFSFNYTIGADTKIAKDGLPAGLFRPANMLRVTLTPKTHSDTLRVVELCKNYGYYLSLPYKSFVGIR